jgi:type IV pilus assembly protein PilB
VYEIMEISPRLRGLIASRAPTDTIRETAVEEGMLTLQESARQLVLDGTTSLQEMLSISVEDMNTILENS